MEKNDFVRIKYSGRLKGIDKPLDVHENAPVVVGIGRVMKGVDEALLEMNMGDKKEVEVPAEKGFGKRDPKLIKLIPISEFRKHKQKPYPGMIIDGDGIRGKVLSVSGGRVKVDFNHPLAGRTLVYNIEVIKKIEDNNEKIRSIIDWYVRARTDAENEINKKIELKVGDKAIEIILPQLMNINSVYKKKIAFDIMNFLGLEYVKFSEIFEKPKDEKKEETKKEEKKDKSEEKKE